MPDKIVPLRPKLVFDDRYPYKTQVSNFTEILLAWIALIPPADGRTDRHDDANGRFSIFVRKRLKVLIFQNIASNIFYVVYIYISKTSVKNVALILQYITYLRNYMCIYIYIYKWNLEVSPGCCY